MLKCKQQSALYKLLEGNEMKKEVDNRLMEWTINKAKTEFKDDICLMLELNTCI